MPDPSSAAATAIYTEQLKSLELLFDYTKFHIGLYLTLAGAYITIASVKANERLVVDLKLRWMWLAMIAFMVAGLAGGIIASSITQCIGAPKEACESAATFLEQPTGPWGPSFYMAKGRTWTWIEHTSFWVGLIFALLSFAGEGPNKFIRFMCGLMRKRTPRSSRAPGLRSRLAQVGVVLLVLGTGPLVGIILCASLGFYHDPNPVGLGMLAAFTFWPSVILIGLGVWRARRP